MKNSPTWRNWSGTVESSPALTIRPADRHGIVTAVEQAATRNQTIRPRGSGHSGVPLVATDGVVIDLSNWTGLERVDIENRLITVRSGTTLRSLNEQLHGLGLALTNLGDIDSQTLAGALATGTHGTGLRLGGMPTQVQAMEIILADGTSVTCSATERPELFDAARTNLGALGIVSTVTLRCEPAFALTASEFPEPVDSVLSRIDEYVENTHFEFYWFPHTRNALVKCANRVPATESARPMHPLRHWLEYEVLENGALGLICRTGRAVPAVGPSLNRLCANLLSHRNYSDRSYRVLTSRRAVRFVECEYSVPFEALIAVFEQLRSAVGRLSHPVMIPIEVRFAAADAVWLSPAYRRRTAYVSVQQYVGMPYREYFSLFEAIVESVGGRPHLGKIHSLTSKELGKRYPRLTDFARMSAELDPVGTFRNHYLDGLLGVDSGRRLRADGLSMEC
ncbi:L-gulonolactone oxidase [Nocardia sputorum]|uniref:D-arabinono-1,4-lactone oxidase n=1 Tax=Nocardia sputorum TaxID=2984338 RepID=UPI002492D4AF|nr:D-arabinono-1,4-lactone oxidase [Nocardia sputorum]BDT92380.1 L-gulonolactone oxidase [Nocardia sputorum]